MLGNMRRALRHCLAAGAIGVGATFVGAAAAADVTPAQARAEAVKVELAWMADARAFSQHLQVLATPEGLEVRGQVADETTRQHVLRLARQSCYLPVRDALEVGPDRVVGDDLLRRAAFGTIAQELGSRAANVSVAAEPGGVVVLTGKVPTADDKLEAGRCLRGMSGCRRVVNRIEVGDAPPRPLTVPTPPSPTRLVSGEVAPPIDALPVPKPKDELPPPTPKKEKAEPSVPTPAALALPDVPTPVVPVAPPLKAVRIQVYRAPLDPGPRPVVQPRITGYATSGTVTAAPVGQLGYMPCGGEVKLEMAAVDPPPTMMQRFFRSLLGVKHSPTKCVVVPTPVEAMPTPSVVEQVVPATAPDAPRPVTTASAVRPTAAPSIWPPAHAAAKRYRPVPTPTAPEPPLLTPTAAREVASPEPRPREPLVKEAVPPMPTIATPPVPAAAPAVVSPERLRAQVVAGCAKLVREVKIEKRADGTFTLHIHASAKVEHELVARLLNLPQVVSSNAHIQIHLTQ